MSEGAPIVGLLCALVIGIPIGTLIGAVILRAAIALYNKMAGGASSPSGVPMPAFGKAMWISFAICFAQIVVGFLIVAVTSPRATASGTGENEVNVVAELISFPVSLLIMVAILSSKLPTTFGRAILVTLCYMLVTLCYMLISILIVGVLVAVAFILLGVYLKGTGI
jgi:hypothetical protein